MPIFFFFSFRIADNIRIVLDGPLLIQLMGFVALICFTLLFIDQNKDKFDFNMVLALNSLTSQCLLNYVACYYSDHLKDDLFEVGEVVYNLQWYKIAHNEREFLPWIIRRSQKPISFSGYRIIDCSLATFMKVKLI